MSYIEIYDPATGQRTRREFSGQSRWTNGKSREQGIQGVVQGNRGWEAQYGGGSYSDAVGSRANSLLDSITKKNSVPSLRPITHSLLSKEGFNQALQNVQIHNLQKLAEQRRRTLASALGSVLRSSAAIKTAGINSAARVRTAALDAATRKYGIDRNYDIRSKGLDEQQRYHDALIDYNRGQLDTQRDRLQLEAWKAKQPKQPKQINPMDAAIKRQKLANNPDFLKGIYGEDVYSAMGDDEKAKAVASFITSGKLPSFGVEKRMILPNKVVPTGQDIDPFAPAAAQGHKSAGAATPAPKIGPDHIAAIHNEIAKEYGVSPDAVKFDPNSRLYILPNGKALPLDAAYQTLYGGQ